MLQDEGKLRNSFGNYIAVMKPSVLKTPPLAPHWGEFEADGLREINREGSQAALWTWDQPYESWRFLPWAWVTP